MTKKQLRKQLLEKRASLMEEERREKSERIVKKILDSKMYEQSRVLFSFVPFDHEIDTRPLLEQAVADGKRVAVPYTDTENKEMILYEFESWDQLVSGVYGIMEPNPALAQRVDPADIDVIIMPGVGFDRDGGRIGYGGGFYDRFLEKLTPRPPLVAPCFAVQIVESVPMEAHDFRVDYIVTEEEFTKREK